MSTLARDFSDGRSKLEYHSEHAAQWVLWNVPEQDRSQAVADIARAYGHDPSMVEWATWPVLRARGAWLRGRAS